MVEARKEDLLPETHKPPVLSEAGPVWGGVGGSEGESTSPGSGCPRRRVRAGGRGGSG